MCCFLVLSYSPFCCVSVYLIFFLLFRDVLLFVLFLSISFTFCLLFIILSSINSFVSPFNASLMFLRLYLLFFLLVSFTSHFLSFTNTSIPLFIFISLSPFLIPSFSFPPLSSFSSFIFLGFHFTVQLLICFSFP